MQFQELIQTKEGLLRRLVPISQRQLEIVRSGDVTLLLQLLGKKQKLMDEFEEVERQLTPYRDIPPEKRTWNSEAERLRMAELIARCSQMLEEILVNDQQSADELAAQKSEVEEQIRRVGQGARMQAAYSKQAAEGAVYRFDRDS